MMLTEAKDKNNLTENDKKAMETIQKAVPGVNVIPIGEETAWTPWQEGGAHCLANPVPWKIEGPGEDTVPGQPQPAPAAPTGSAFLGQIFGNG